MKVVLLLSLIVASEAVAPRWYSGTCGTSKYTDAGTWNRTLLPNSFGIINGQEARLHEYPWMAAVIVLVMKPLPACGGAILNERWIITSGHVVDFLRKNFLLNQTQVVVGEHRYQESNPYRRYYNVSRFIVHEKFEMIPNVGVYYDLALLKLDTDIVMSDEVRPICAPDPDNLYAHEMGVVSGWGYTEDPAPSPVLRFVILKILTNAECIASDTYGNYSMPENQLCATDNREDTAWGPCRGDSGAPFAVKSSSSIFRLVGILWGTRGNCTAGYPSKYMRIGHLVDWITPYVGNYSRDVK